jgi:hypothetical protein
MARFTAPIPSWGGDFRPPALDRRLSLRTTDKTIMIRVPTTCRRDDRLVARSGKREEARRDRDRLRGEILATHPGRPQDTLLTVRRRLSQSNNTGCPRSERCGGVKVVKSRKIRRRPRADVWRLESENRVHLIASGDIGRVDPSPPLSGRARNGSSCAPMPSSREQPGVRVIALKRFVGRLR